MKRLSIALVMLFLAAPLLAQTAAPPAGPAEATVVRFLGLSDEQVETWHGLVQARQETAAPVRQALGEVHDQLAELFAQENPDPTAVGTLVLQRRELEGQLADIQRTYVEGFEAMLDEEQAHKLQFVRRAAAIQDVIPAFQRVGLVRRH